MYKEMSHKKTIELEQLKAELHSRIEQSQHVEDKDHSKEVSKNKIDIDYSTCIYMYMLLVQNTDIARREASTCSSQF